MSEEIQCPYCTIINIIPKKEINKVCECCAMNLLDYSPIIINYDQSKDQIPEFHVSRKMITIGGKLNNLHIDFMIDTGCQSTCISNSLIQLCGLDHLINTLYEGIVNGVGQKKILGKIFKTDILFDFGIIPTSILVIEDDEKSPPIALLGLDILFSYGCVIDFKNRVTKINNQIKIPF
jgi:hypothetical protein